MLIKSNKESDFKNFPIIKEKSFFVDQRSNEWLDLRKIYLPVGNPTNIYENYIFQDDWVEKLFHLIVGCIGELYVMYNVEWSKLFHNFKFVNRSRDIVR